MSSLFQFRDKVEGKVGIGKLPSDLQSILDEISQEYYTIIPDKNASTYHTWFKDMPSSIKSKVSKLQKDSFWNKLCDGSDKCIKINANEMDELYYSNPKKNIKKQNLYGATGNYDIHKDCFFNFNGIKFYRILIGLTNGNDNIITNFNNLNVGHKLNLGDYIVFDFDNTSHQVIKENDSSTPRIMLKIHYIVCENCKYSKEYVDKIKHMYLIYENITRYIMQTGTDPESFYEFFMGLLCQFFTTKYIEYILIGLIIIFTIIIKYVYKIKFVYKNWSIYLKYIFFFLFITYISIVFFYWTRYQLFNVR